jgi:lipopolysaccharide export LptBFGC system permease protein LptF
VINWKNVLRDILITTIIGVISFVFILPSVVNYFVKPKDFISYQVKENIAIAAQKYFKQENNKNLVSVEELINKGYISDQAYLENMKCNNHISSISVEKKEEGKNKYDVDLYCNKSISKLTLSN